MEGAYERNWNLKCLLGDLIGATAEFAPEARAEIWASDLGKPFVDRWLQMKGVPYSNPASGQDLMTFYLGKQIELGFAQMLTRCGVAFRSQERLAIQLADCLPVVGRPDLVLEVKDWQQVWDACEGRLSDPGMETGETTAPRQAIQRLLATWQARCPEGLPPMAFEIKSLNSQAFKYHRGNGGLSSAYPHHRLQLYTYLHALKLEEGHLLYVARDTGWIEEVVVRATEDLEERWLEDVATMSRYYLADERPPLEPVLVDGRGNWRVNYSRYKDYLYQEVQNGAFSF
jgi:hypothetical protein